MAEEPLRKKAKLNNVYIRLASSSPSSVNDDSESVHSVQDKETVIVKDTSDTDWSEFSNVREYDVAELSDTDNPLNYEQFSSGETEVEGIAQLGAVVAAVLCDSEIDLAALADNSTECSTSPSSFSDADPELHREDYCDFSTCAQCREPNNDSNYRYCSKCYSIRKKFFPPRPKPRRRKLKKTNSSGSDLKVTQSSVESTDTVDGGNIVKSVDVDTVDGVQLTTDISLKSGANNSYTDQFSQPSTSSGSSSITEETKKTSSSVYCEQTKLLKSASVDSDSTSTECVCPVCFQNPKNGLFVHGKTAHLYCCYNCALKTWSCSGCCSLCRKKIRNVIKLDQLL